MTFNLYSCLINVLKLLYIIDDWLIKIWKPMSKRYFNMLKNRLRWLPLDESFFSSALMYAVILDVYSWLYMLEIRERIYIVSVFQTKSCRIWHSNKIYTPQKCRYKEVIVSNFTSYKYIKVVPKWVLKKSRNWAIITTVCGLWYGTNMEADLCRASIDTRGSKNPQYPRHIENRPQILFIYMNMKCMLYIFNFIRKLTFRSKD